MTQRPPFIVAHNGTVADRATGTVIGSVSLTRNGWIGRHLNGRLVQKAHWNGRKYAARALYEESPFYVPRPTYQHPEE